jgi:hypothetical protein
MYIAKGMERTKPIILPIVVPLLRLRIDFIIG